MYQAYDATIGQDGSIKLPEGVKLPAERRAIVIVLDDAPPVLNECYLMSEASLGTDWNRPEEDAAWAYLQSEK